MLDFAPGSALGAYVIAARIGAGGMATVYRAHHPALERDVAIKVISHLYENQPEFVERFRREARAASRLRHPHILTVYDFVEQDDLAYLVTELLPGGTLSERMRGPLPFTEVVRVLRGIGAALDTAHSAGLIHRDVKPQNILYTRENEPVLADFGIARLDETLASLTVEGALIGTPFYLAPEMASGGEVSGASDLYSLGVVLYEMLAGEVPFPGTTPIAVIKAHVYDPPPPLTARNPRISPRMAAVVHRALAKQSQDRYPSCAALAAAFEQAMLSPEDSPKSRTNVRTPPPFSPPNRPTAGPNASPSWPSGTGGRMPGGPGLTGGGSRTGSPGQTGHTGQTGHPGQTGGTWTPPPVRPQPTGPHAPTGAPNRTGGWQNTGQYSQPGFGGAPHPTGYPPGSPPPAYPSNPGSPTGRWPEAAPAEESGSRPPPSLLIVAAVVIIVTIATYALRVTGVIPESLVPFSASATLGPTATVIPTATVRVVEPTGIASPAPVVSPAPAVQAPEPVASPAASPSPGAVVLPSNTPLPTVRPSATPPRVAATATPNLTSGPPNATITSLKDGDLVSERPLVIVQLSGVLQPGQHLWALIHPDRPEDNWWPHKTELIPGPDGIVRIENTEIIGGAQGSRHVIAVGVVDEDDHRAIQTQVETRQDQPFDKGQPPGFRELSRVTVVKQ